MYVCARVRACVWGGIFVRVGVRACVRVCRRMKFTTVKQHSNSFYKIMLSGISETFNMFGKHSNPPSSFLRLTVTSHISPLATYPMPYNNIIRSALLPTKHILKTTGILTFAAHSCNAARDPSSV